MKLYSLPRLEKREISCNFFGYKEVNLKMRRRSRERLKKILQTNKSTMLSIVNGKTVRKFMGPESGGKQAFAILN